MIALSFMVEYIKVLAESVFFWHTASTSNSAISDTTNFEALFSE